MRTLKLALAAAAAFAFNANAQVTGMGSPPTGIYQPPVVGYSAANNITFHAGGVAACDGCHVMHNATSGQAKSTRAGSTAAPWSGVTNMYLLQGSDQSSTCLICHAGAATRQFMVFDDASVGALDTAPGNRTPGGDFAWLSKSWKNSPGRTHGHNVAAADFGLAAETGRTAPGGTWTNGSGRRQFACSSCHDPHGRYRVQTDGTTESFVGPGANGQMPAGALPIAATGSYGEAPSQSQYAVGTYRLLAGQFYAPASNPSAPFANDPPFAVAPVTYNKNEGPADGGEVRVAYGRGMSEWCQNCHGSIHLDNYSSGVAGLKHPAGSDARFHVTQVQVYNSYISSGRVGTLTDPYTSLVPFESGATGRTALVTAAAGGAIRASETSAVMCLSCHRAHATAFDSMVRWDGNATFLTDGADFTPGLTSANAAGTGAERSATVTRAGYYNRSVATAATIGAAGTIGTYQRSLCNKCHGKD